MTECVIVSFTEMRYTLSKWILATPNHEILSLSLFMDEKTEVHGLYLEVEGAKILAQQYDPEPTLVQP